MGIVAAVIGVSALGYGILLAGSGSVVRGTPRTPVVNLRAFRGHGTLAFVSRNRLWVLTGTGKLRLLPTPRGQVAESPTFSHDGHWLAYLTHTGDPNDADDLWIARANGSGADEVGRVKSLVGWSPRADTLAITAGTQTRDPPYGRATSVALVSPTRTVRTLVHAPRRPATPGGVDAILGSVWSPNGSALAVALGGGQSASIESVPLTGGATPSVWFATRGSAVPVTGMRGRMPTEVIPKLAGWWPGQGIAFWIDDFGAVDNRDSTPLAVIARPGAPPRLLADTLSTAITDATAPGAAERLALVASSISAGRAFGTGKQVETCGPRTACTPIPAATIWLGPNGQTCDPCIPPAAHRGATGSGVSEDPAWSPSGTKLAYVKAPVVDTGASPGAAWFADHAIYTWSPATGATAQVGSIDGAAAPTWSANGRDLLYEGDNGLWMMPVATGKPVEIEHPLYPPAEWKGRASHLPEISFYGQIPWGHQFSWFSS